MQIFATQTNYLQPIVIIVSAAFVVAATSAAVALPAQTLVVEHVHYLLRGGRLVCALVLAAPTY